MVCVVFCFLVFSCQYQCNRLAGKTCLRSDLLSVVPIVMCGLLTVCGLMVQCVGRTGTVHRITDRGDVRVQYEGANNRWTFHAGSLTKVECVSFYLCDVFVNGRFTLNAFETLSLIC